MLDMQTTMCGAINLRNAQHKDRAALDSLRIRSLEGILSPLLTSAQQSTMYEYTSFDPALIDDGTYYVLEVDDRIVASGGWSRRAARYRHQSGNEEPDRFLDPGTEAAGIRAMYTDPDFARRGIGTLMLAAAETGARIGGFRRAELVATPTGRRLYMARGWREKETFLIGGRNSSGVPVSRMEKML
jgi:GNAT superfamily N-acetyltransferase